MRPGFVYVIAAIDVDGLKPPTKVEAAHDDIGHNAYLKVYPKLNIADTLGPYQRKRREWAKKFQNFGQS